MLILIDVFPPLRESLDVKVEQEKMASLDVVGPKVTKVWLASQERGEATVAPDLRVCPDLRLRQN